MLGMETSLNAFHQNEMSFSPGLVAQPVASLIAGPGVISWTLVWPLTFMEINHEVFATVYLLLLVIQEGLLSVTMESVCTKYRLTTKSKLAQDKKCC